MPRILVTGFQPWAQHACNLSWDGLRACRPSLPSDWELRRLLLPVSWTDAIPLLEAALAEGPDLAVGFGQYGGSRIRLETTARNRVDADRPDGSGARAAAAQIDPEGPVSLASSLPLDAIAERLNAEAIPFCRSNDAGGFLCNFIFYRLTLWAARRQKRATVGFVHVPQKGGLPEERVARAMAIVIERSLQPALSAAK